jgi:hypothetical protein
MNKTLTALAAAGAIALAAATAPTDAQAGCRGCGVAAGVLGGIAAGAIIGGAIANSPPPPPAYGYAPVAGYEPYAYAAPVPVGCPGGYWARRPMVDRWGNVVGYSRPRYFCPGYWLVGQQFRVFAGRLVRAGRFYFAPQRASEPAMRAFDALAVSLL